MSDETLYTHELAGTEVVLNRGKTKVARAVVEDGKVTDAIIYGPAGREWDEYTYRNLAKWSERVATEMAQEEES